MTIVDLEPNESSEVSVWIGSAFSKTLQLHTVEIHRPPRWPDLLLMLTNPTDLKPLEPIEDALIGGVPIHALTHTHRVDLTGTLTVGIADRAITVRAAPGSALLGGVRPADWPINPAITGLSRRGNQALRRPEASFMVDLSPGIRREVKFQLTAPEHAKPGEELDVDVVQRDERGRVVGGVTYRIRICERRY